MSIKHLPFKLPQMVILPLLGVILALMALLPLPWNETITDSWSDALFQLRGERQLPEDFLLVYISAEDVETLGGWPVTRDYYAYMTHFLREKGAAVIGFDILFEKNAPRYKEYDLRLAGLFGSAGNVCLPVSYSELTPPPERPGLYQGQKPVYPLAMLRKNAAALGFSNLGSSPRLRKLPLAVQEKDTVRLSFGAELARLYLDGDGPAAIRDDILALPAGTESPRYIPLDGTGQLRLNHFGGLTALQRISFVDLLQASEARLDSLQLSGKLVLVAATAPGLPVLRATPLSGLFPAGLVQLTVAENIIRKNYLREIPWYLHLLLVLMAPLMAVLFWQLSPRRSRMILVVAGILLPLAALPLFNYANLILPVFYPLLAYLATLFYLAAAERRREDLAGISHQQQLEAQIRHKASALDEARAQLEQLQTQLQTQTADAEEYRRQSASAEDAVRQLENELRDLQEYIVPEKAAAPAEMAGIIHAPEGRMSEVLELVSRIRGSDIPVLIVGETGTGKEMIARAIHDTGGRKGRPFIAINCGALPENLLESELFGHEKGAFTGAQARRRGRFELADGGTIFLDEITETTPAFQARLLRVLQEGSFERVGGEETIEVDVRVIAACNRDLQQEIGSGAFRSDLYYRLNGFPIPLPPLRERPEDIPLLADHFLKKHAAGRVDAISDQVMEMLRIYRWPGNVRELENAVRRAALLAQGEQRSILRLSDLPPEIRPGNPEGVSEAVYQPLETQILALLRGFKFSRSSITQTAQALGNRDRGTITEYFRGICFEALVQAQFDVEKASRNIAGSDDTETLERVRRKLERYLSNLQPLPDLENLEDDALSDLPQFKGLPKKYHPYLIQILEQI